MMRVAFFVDGFNLYHTIKKIGQNSLKWLDIAKLCRSYISPHTDTIAFVKFFTTLTDWNTSRMARHQVYLKALESTGVEIIYGKFKMRDVTCKLCKGIFTKHEEKQTDVNIAISLLKTAYSNLYDKAVILTADSDMIPAIREVRMTFPSKRVGVLLPYGASSVDLVNNCDFKLKMKYFHLQINRFPDQIITSSGDVIQCPIQWR